MDLNDIIMNLLDWMHDSKIVVKNLYVYSECGGVYLKLNLLKKKDGVPIEISRIFYLDGVCCSENWVGLANNFMLDEMVEKIKNARVEDVTIYPD